MRPEAPLSLTRLGMTNRVAEIIDLESRADELESDASALRWQAAERIAAELAEGKTQRQLASEISKSQGHVAKCSKIWLMYGSDSPENRPAWAEAYQGVSGKSKARKPMTTQERFDAMMAEYSDLDVEFVSTGDSLGDVRETYARLRRAHERWVRSVMLVVEMHQEEGLPLCHWVRDALAKIATTDDEGFPL